MTDAPWDESNYDGPLTHSFMQRYTVTELFELKSALEKLPNDAEHLVQVNNELNHRGKAYVSKVVQDGIAREPGEIQRCIYCKKRIMQCTCTQIIDHTGD